MYCTRTCSWDPSRSESRSSSSIAFLPPTYPSHLAPPSSLYAPQNKRPSLIEQKNNGQQGKRIRPFHILVSLPLSLFSSPPSPLHPLIHPPSISLGPLFLSFLISFLPHRPTSPVLTNSVTMASTSVDTPSTPPSGISEVRPSPQPSGLRRFLRHDQLDLSRVVSSNLISAKALLVVRLIITLHLVAVFIATLYVSARDKVFYMVPTTFTNLSNIGLTAYYLVLENKRRRRVCIISIISLPMDPHLTNLNILTQRQ